MTLIKPGLGMPQVDPADEAGPVATVPSHFDHLWRYLAARGHKQRLIDVLMQR